MDNNTQQISQKLVDMFTIDQKLRRTEPQDWKTIIKVDNENRDTTKKIIDKYGLISISKFGKEASYAAWLLVQHFPPEDVKLMENYLKLMENDKDDIDIKNI